MQAIILAAGMGSRLKELTSDHTKGMVEVNGISMMERMLRQLDEKNLNKIVVVVGYKADDFIDYIDALNIKTKIEYVNNEIYDTTNNIYSLYLAKDYLVNDDTLLFESDLIFEDKVLDKLIDHPYPSLALVDKYEAWMDGTVVKLDEDNNIIDFLGKAEFDFNDINEYYKTVNIYKFSQEFSQDKYVPFLEAYRLAMGDNEYYERVLKIIAGLENPGIKALPLDNDMWYEIDDKQDLDIAESMFAQGELKLEKIQNRFGGYWRYPELVDFCYLVNPHYPPKKLVDEVKANLDRLIRDYPSGMGVNTLITAKYFNIKEEYILIGNGASELIKVAMEKFTGNTGIIYPTFEEYPNRVHEEIIAYLPKDESYLYGAEDLIEFYDDKDIGTLVLINPDNPSGNYIMKEDVLKVADWAMKKDIKFILDESFIDFSDAEENGSLLENEILEKYPNLILIKSISKSYGVPGFRLGILASSDKALIKYLKKEVSIWNINSFGEYFMQIAEKYDKYYHSAMAKFKEIRKEYVNDLSEINNLRLIPSQANYIMCELLGDMSSKELTQILLEDHNMFIKDLSDKRGFDGQYIRIAVKRVEENNRIVQALKDLLD